MERNGLANGDQGMSRQKFFANMGVTGATLQGVALDGKAAAGEVTTINEVKQGEDVFAYGRRGVKS
jgi:hypothetical protein